MLVLATALRLYDLGGESLWLDEAHMAITELQRPSFAALMRDSMATMRGTLPLHQSFLYFWGNALGTSEAMLRLPSALAGILAVAAVLLIGFRAITWRATGLVVALLLAMNPTHLAYSQEARCYSFFLLFSAASCAAFLALVFATTHTRRAALIYVATTTALLYTHLFAVLVLLAQAAVLVAECWGRRSRPIPWIRPALAIAALYLPALWLDLKQIGMEFDPELAHSFIPKPDLKTIPHILKQFAGGEHVADGLPLFALMTIGVAFGAASWLRREIDHWRSASAGAGPDLLRERLMVAWLAIMLGVPLVVSIAVTPVLSDARYVLPALVPFLWLAACGLRLLPVVPRRLALATVLAFLAAELPSYYGELQREPWRDVASLVREMGEEADPILVTAPFVSTPLVYYLGTKRRILPLAAQGGPERIERSRVAAFEQLADDRATWLVASHDRGMGIHYAEALAEERDTLVHRVYPAISVYRFGARE